MRCGNFRDPRQLSLTKTTLKLRNLLTLGLAQCVALKRDLAEGEMLTWDDVGYDPADEAVVVRREMEAVFREPHSAAMARV